MSHARAGATPLHPRVLMWLPAALLLAWGALSASGVLLALKSGELAADAIADGIAKGDVSEAQLGRWGDDFNQGVDRMRRLVCEYYNGFSFGAFVRNFPELRGTVTDLLIGDLFTSRVDKVWGPMESLYSDDHPRIPAWNQGAPPEEEPEKRELGQGRVA